MSAPKITTREQLHHYLYAAMQLEHATIPPYLTALYSIRPGTNADAYHVLRVTAVEEMLHLTLAANLLNAVGGTPDLTKPGFVPEYPAYLPDGESDFQVSRRRFSKEALETFLSIERPRKAPSESARLVHRGHAKRNRLGVRPDAAGDAVLQHRRVLPRDLARGAPPARGAGGRAVLRRPRADRSPRSTSTPGAARSSRSPTSPRPRRRSN